jgi:hypothetical protein
MPAGIVTADLVATGLFALALVHTFSTKYFEHLAHMGGAHAGLWRLMGEVETVFGFWALVLLVFLGIQGGIDAPIRHLEARSFTEPAFVFVIMVIAASRPVIHAAETLLLALSRLLPLPHGTAYFAVLLGVAPLLGSFITEPAAMTLAALVLRDRFLSRQMSARLRYATVGTLFVNISIGGALTPFAAPPILMVAGTWGWDIGHVAATFGLKAALAVAINTALLTLTFRKELAAIGATSAHTNGKTAPPPALTLVHLLFLGGVVYFAHHPQVFLGLFLFFLGVTHAYRQHQRPLILREGLMVAFFLAGLVVLGAKQEWWLERALAGMADWALYFGATALTAITDNAALTYLGSLVPNVTEGFKYSLVAGAITGGGLTVIANAPNPAGFAILKGTFEDETISAGGLFLAALPATLVAVGCFQYQFFASFLT